MNKCMLGLCMLVNAAAPPVTPFQPPPNAPVRQQVRLQDPAVVLITIAGEKKTSLCTAFVVKKNVLVTAKHCIRPKTNITAQFELPLPPVIVAVHALATKDGEDWAILTGETPNQITPFTVSPTLPGQTAMVYSVGYPTNHAVMPPDVTGQYLSRGRYLVYDPTRGGLLLYLPLYPGESGGPILDDTGKVVGIISAIVLYDERLTEVSVASPSAQWIESIP
jgi:serine protease Do